MNFWEFHYNRRYYLTHPWKWLDDFFRSLKFMSQRAVRGWDDRIIWSIDDYLATMMPIWLRQLKEDKGGFPIIDDLEIEYDTSAGADNKDYYELAEDRWDNLLQLMIEGFESAKLLIDDEIPIFEEAHKIMDTKEYIDDFMDSIAQFSEVVDSLGGRSRIEAERNMLYDSFKAGMEVFTNYFFSLWD